ncbi:MAG: hypothetical protein AAB268_11610 [Elusimicrobiota bacterium]
MANYSNYRFPIAEANRLASLTGIEQDLLGVISYCDYLIERSDIAKLDALVWEAISAAAIVRYARCFTTGVRDALTRELFNTDNDLAKKHDRFIDLRSKHVAHSVNNLEENEVVVQIGDHYVSSTEIRSINTMHKRVVGLSLNEPHALKQISQTVLEKARAMMVEEKALLLELARGCPLAELRHNGLPDLSLDEKIDSPRQALGKRKRKGGAL